MKSLKTLVCAAVLGGLSIGIAQATETLNFAGLNATAEEQVLNYYNGGFGGDGSGPGPNYGIVFSTNAITANDVADGGCCNVSNVPGGPGANALYFLSGAAATMDVSAGFTTGFSFDYSSINVPGTVTVYSGLDGTGTLLATLLLPVTPSGGGTCDAAFCPFEPIGVTFAGTAESVDFAGTENQIAFADVTLGSSTPTATPLPSTWTMLIAGFLGLGFFAFRGSKKNGAAIAAA